MMKDSTWHCGPFRFVWGKRTLIMGIVNVTPDSFSDGGDYLSPTRAIEHAYRLFEQGADLVDVGGESTRPGADAVSIQEEINRVLPVIREIAGHGNLPVSIDTTHYETAQQALVAGACIINDISGLQQEPRLANLAAQHQSGLILMHIRGTPQTMQKHTDYEDMIGEIRAFLEKQIEYAKHEGVQTNQLCIDPGIGFSKTAEQNLTLINRLNELWLPDIPLLLGVSRKSFIGKITGVTNAKQRIFGTIAANTLGICRGADIIRVHDVIAAREAADVAEAILQETVHIL